MHFKKTLKKERQVKTMAKKKIGIIGGGISGAGLAYHLSLYEGEADVTVFEKDTIGGASTAKSAGTVCLFDDSLKNRYWDVRLYGFESYLKMEEEEKGSAGFDKTGTLTKAKPTVVDVVPFDNNDPEEMLRIAACMEEHFPHSMAKAVVSAARKKHLAHEEMHSKVEYVVAHGISTTIEDHKAVIGSYHFVFEDEKCLIPEDGKEKFDNIPEEYSHLYLAIDGRLAAVICIEDPLREEAKASVEALRGAGISKIVMMTGDSERTAAAIARRVGVDEYYSEVLPEDKANFIEKEKAAGRKVIMVGDGINDSPALSAANVGIAISDGAEIAREIADITVGADDLQELVVLKEISNALMKRIRSNYRFIITFNAGLIACGVAGILQPTSSALLHNTSTLAISLKSMQNLLP